MKKFLLSLLLLIIVLAAVIYFGSGYALGYAVRKMTPDIQAALADRGIQLHDLNFRAIRFTSPVQLTVFDLQAAASMAMPVKKSEMLNAHVYAGRFDVALVRFKDPAIRLSCDQVSLYAEGDQQIPGTTFGRFDHGYWSCGEPIPVNRLASTLSQYLAQFNGLFQEEQTVTSMRLRALVTFNARGKQAQAYLYTVNEADGARLRFETADIQKAAQIFEQELSPDEIEIISYYPSRAPLIMSITSEARRTAREAHARDRSVPEDAFRHVLWSYLLARAFDEAFAKQVTDAHEILPTNTAAERRMDYINNRQGRDYARRGVPQNQILSLVRTDPQVVRSPEEVQISGADL